jgi:hypothetical protein
MLSSVEIFTAVATAANIAASLQLPEMVLCTFVVTNKKVISCGGRHSHGQRCAMLTTGTERSNYNLSNIRVSNNPGWQHQLYALKPNVSAQSAAAAFGLHLAHFSSFRDDDLPQRPMYSMKDGTDG